jgi:peptidoglycan hydrolase-like protein with peptidoglycan-binding domain
MATFVKLPKSGAGFTTYSRERDGADQWALPDVVCALLYLGSKRAGAFPDFSVGDMSKQGGGKFLGHSSHKDGQDVDIRPMRTDSQNAPVQYNWSPYSRAHTRSFLQDLRRFCVIEAVLFNDPELVKEKLCKSYKGHDNHIHVKFAAKQKHAVAWFQAKHGLVADGVAGAQTIAALMRLSEKKSVAVAVSGDAATDEGREEGSNGAQQPLAPVSAPQTSFSIPGVWVGNEKLPESKLTTTYTLPQTSEPEKPASNPTPSGIPENVAIVKAEKPGLFSKIQAAWAYLSAPVLAIGAKYGGLLENPRVQVGLLILAGVGLIVGAWLWNEAKKRADARTMFNADNAANKETKDVWITNDPKKYETGDWMKDSDVKPVRAQPMSITAS